MTIWEALHGIQVESERFLLPDLVLRCPVTKLVSISWVKEVPQVCPVPILTIFWETQEEWEVFPVAQILDRRSLCHVSMA